MAEQKHVIITDDLDGTEGAATYAFSWQGTAYEIDLNDTHRDEFLRALQPYISAGRRTGPARPGATPRSGDSAAIRQWARENGLRITDRGAIPGWIRKAYDQR